MSPNKEYIFSELEKATKGLAAATLAELRASYRDDCLDDLAEDFSTFVSAVVPFLEKTDQPGLKLLLEIDEYLESISGCENSHLWTRQAFLDDHNWSSIRGKAVFAVQHFSWG